MVTCCDSCILQAHWIRPNPVYFMGLCYHVTRPWSTRRNRMDVDEREEQETLSSVTSGRRRRHGKVGEGAKKTKGSLSLAVAGSRPPNPAAPLISGRLSHSSTDFAVLLGGLRNGGRIRIFPQGLGQQHGCSRGVRIPDLIRPSDA